MPFRIFIYIMCRRVFEQLLVVYFEEKVLIETIEVTTDGYLFFHVPLYILSMW
jgi:hypothetical protein